MFLFVVVLRKKLENKNLDYIKKRFGTFFNEFKEGGPIYSMFYVFYIIRRIVIASSFVFFNDGVLQLSLIMGVSFIVMFK